MSIMKNIAENGITTNHGVFNSIYWDKTDAYRERVEVLIFNKEKQLFLYMTDNETYHGTRYRIPGGSIEQKRTNKEQCHTEVLEEINMKITNLEFHKIQKLKYKNKCKVIHMGGKRKFRYVGTVDHIYTAELKEILPERNNKFMDDGKFYDFDEIKDMLLPHHRQIAIKYLSRH